MMSSLGKKPLQPLPPFLLPCRRYFWWTFPAIHKTFVLVSYAAWMLLTQEFVSPFATSLSSIVMFHLVGLSCPFVEPNKFIWPWKLPGPKTGCAPKKNTVPKTLFKPPINFVGIKIMRAQIILRPACTQPRSDAPSNTSPIYMENTKEHLPRPP